MVQPAGGLEHEMHDRRAQWEKRHAAPPGGPPEPMGVLRQFDHLLPSTGRALDLACGAGGNALYLARLGLDTVGWDYAPSAVRNLAALADGLPLVAELRDVIASPPTGSTFDVICVGHFLERALCPAIAAALRPGGLLYYQTFVRERVAPVGPSSGKFLLAPNELLTLFPDLLVRAYRDEGQVGDPERGVRNVAQLVVQAPVAGRR